MLRSLILTLCFQNSSSTAAQAVVVAKPELEQKRVRCRDNLIMPLY